MKDGEESPSRRRFIKSAVAGVALPLLVGAPKSPEEERTKQAKPMQRIGYAGGAGQTLTTTDAFSIFWITDTQFLSEANPGLYRMVTNWIVDNWQEYNGKLVIHTGDIVEDGGVLSEWQNANDAMTTLLNNGIPYTWCAGNHDDAVEGEPTSGWIGSDSAPAFDPSTVSEKVNALGYVTWAGDYHEGMNTAVSFFASGLNFLVINIEWNAPSDVLAWAAGLMGDPQYEGYHVIVAPHAYIDAYGSLQDTVWGAELTDFINGLTPLLDENSSSVFLTLNGHFPTDCGYNTPTMINGRNELMFDRQDSTDEPGQDTGRGADDDSTPNTERVGGATITILTFSPTANQIRIRTLDLFRGKWRDAPTEEYALQMLSYVQPPPER